MEAIEATLTELEALREMVTSLTAVCTDASLLDLICKLLVNG
jgi:hypothetical protein